MYARVTLLEIDTIRMRLDDAVAVFEEDVAPRLRNQPGYQGAYALATPEGKALLMSLWDTEAQADVEADHDFYGQELGHFATLFRSAPGREEYEVLLADEPAEKRA